MKNILIITISLVFAISCKQVEQTIKYKVTDVVKEAGHIHVHKTTECIPKFKEKIVNVIRRNIGEDKKG